MEFFKNAKKKGANGLCIKFLKMLRKKGQMVCVYELWKNLKKCYEKKGNWSLFISYGKFLKTLRKKGQFVSV